MINARNLEYEGNMFLSKVRNHLPREAAGISQKPGTSQ
jgi:hypothetical protein